MQTEFEAKFYPLPKNKELFREQLKTLGAVLKVRERKMRRVLFGKELNPSIHADYIRVRDEGDKITLSAKVHATEDGNLSDQKETCLIINSFDDAKSLLEITGLIASNYQENLRESWEFDGAQIEIDTWPGLETYMEIEAETEEKVKKTAELLGCDWEARIITSVKEIYAKKYNISLSEVRKHLAHITFDHCTF